jgi:hypothetical protein
MSLIAGGASPNIEDCYHKKALDYAVEWGIQTEIVKVLLQASPNPFLDFRTK